MCKKFPSYLSYQKIYDDAYFQTDRETWVHDMIQKSRQCCFRHRYRMLNILHLAVHSQSIFTRLDGNVKKKVSCEWTLANKQKKLPLKRIQKNVLHHIYRPNGPMFKKSVDTVKELLT